MICLGRNNVYVCYICIVETSLITEIKIESIDVRRDLKLIDFQLSDISKSNSFETDVREYQRRAMI